MTTGNFLLLLVVIFYGSVSVFFYIKFPYVLFTNSNSFSLESTVYIGLP